MPVPPRCPFHGKMPVPPRCPFHQDAHSTARCPLHKTFKIIPLLSNAGFFTTPPTPHILTPTPDSRLAQ
ncbi:MAG: hypothetical protein F6J98_16220 [Moorea sp. SIO4G2]|uniref:hypothetical protein n=1 Tax=Moorena TaxID=1155738 RepID=UPI00117DC395|nr:MULTISPECIES: hypothetical protein [Moorena]NEO12071.1 hypothetical protein [Moorena sp. SIO3E8]NEO61892.1 hypothetical protein [Moorena sp. SIO4G2]NEP98186.1 hypothetical protein [Moorena sp. SIO3F7]